MRLKLAALAAVVLGIAGFASPAAAATPVSCMSSFAHIDENVTPGETVTVPWGFDNCGQVPIQVGVEAASITPQAIANPAQSWVTDIDPAVLTLQPGQWTYVHVTVQVPAPLSGGPYVTNILAGSVSTCGSGTCIQIGVGGSLWLWLT